jgi:heme exporter protein B
MTVKTRFAELLLPVLVLPFLVPPVLIGVQGTTRLLAGRSVGEIVGWVEFLALYDLVFVMLTVLIFPSVVDE